MNDQDTTNQMPEGEPPTEPQPQRARRLLRSRSDRMLGGVAGGLGEYFGVDSLIFRIGFGVSVFFGGLGALAYLALMLFVPAQEDDGTVGEAPVQRSRALAVGAAAAVFIFLASWGIFDGDPFWFDRGPFFFGGPLILIAALVAAFLLLRRDRDRAASPTNILTTVAIALGSAIGLSVLALLAAWAGATGSGEVVAATIIAIGVLLVVAAFRGGARWLIVPALALAVPLGAVAAADVSFDGGVGEREYEPVSTAAIPADGYALGIGQLKVDLRQLEWEPDTVLDLDVDLGVGELVVAVPENVCVTGDLDAALGMVKVGGKESDGADVDVQPNAGTEGVPRLELRGDVDLGALIVLNGDDYELDDRHEHFDRGDHDDEMRDAMDAACAAPAVEPDSAKNKKGRR